MSASLVYRFVLGLLVVVATSAAQSSFGALLVNYQFESTDGSGITLTTPDSTGTYTSGATVNAVFGGATPGTTYPQLMTGTDLVSNATWKSLNPNSAMQFFGGTTNTTNGTDGNYNRVSIDAATANANGLGPASPYTAFTVALWAKPDDTPTAEMYLIGKVGSNSSNRGWSLRRVTGTDDLILSYFDLISGGTGPEITASNFFTNDVWTHIAVTFSASNEIKFYKDGVNVKTETGANVLASLAAGNNGAFTVGHRGRTDGQSWAGLLDDVRVYDETRSDAQIQELLVPVPEPGSWILMAIAIGGVLARRRRR
jgi:hypothetical protein